MPKVTRDEMEKIILAELRWVDTAATFIHEKARVSEETAFIQIATLFDLLVDARLKLAEFYEYDQEVDA